MSKHECLHIVVRNGDSELRPKNRAELEAAIGGKAVADSEFFPNDADWLPHHCFCAINPGDTAVNNGFDFDPNYVDPNTDLYFFKPK